MSWNLLCQELLAFAFYFLYASFFEWWFHKYLFHSPKLIKRTFKAAMDWFALPMFVGVHMPIFILIQAATGWQSMWGGIAAIMAYYCFYEYFHYCMHVPAGRLVEKTRLFSFIKEHHRVHHKYMQQNLNVYFPLADKCMGTYRSARSLTTEANAPKGAAPVSPVAVANIKPRPAREQA
jgi:sterol desaturase/sphingolipid hydroxylase (fatty acid hydroxylase superfamily)